MSAKIEINKYYLIDHRTRGMLKVKVLEYEGTEWVKVRILKVIKNMITYITMENLLLKMKLLFRNHLLSGESGRKSSSNT